MSMPLWSLTEERVNDLINQMNKKKDEHDTLAKRHIYELWNADISEMLTVLDAVEIQEEKERAAQGGLKNEGRGKGKKRAPVKAAVKAAAKGETAPVKVPKAKPIEAKKDPSQMSLMERLQMREKTGA
jgi:DNA topoisomerase-2